MAGNLHVYRRGHATTRRKSESNRHEETPAREMGHDAVLLCSHGSVRSYWPDMGAEILIGVVAVALLVFGVGENWSRGYRARKSFQAGIAAFERGDAAAACAAFERTIALEPLWGPARRILARLYANESRFADAEKQLSLACEFEPRNAEALLDLAYFHARYGGAEGPAKAVDAVRKAIAIAPRILETHRESHEVAALRSSPALREFFE